MTTGAPAAPVTPSSVATTVARYVNREEQSAIEKALQLLGYKNAIAFESRTNAARRVIIAKKPDATERAINNVSLNFLTQLSQSHERIERDEKGYTDITNETDLIMQCGNMKYCVMRALVEVRMNNDGNEFMKNASLLAIASNSVAMSRFCTLVKVIYTDCKFFAGKQWPAIFKVRTNDSEGRMVARYLRQLNAASMTPDYTPCDTRLAMTVADVRMFRAQFIELLCQACLAHNIVDDDLEEKTVLLRGDYRRDNEKMRPTSTDGLPPAPVSMWGIDRFTSGVTETIAHIQTQSGRPTAPEDDIVNCMLATATSTVLFAEACAMKYQMNRLNTSNQSAPELTPLRAHATWALNTKYLAKLL